jgi:lysophospholipase L1-like esterase
VSRPDTATFRILALGDSTTAGTPGWKSPIEAPPDGEGDVTSQYAYWLMQARPDWEVLNRGVNRETSAQIRARFARDVLGNAPRAVVIIAGVNDIYAGEPASTVIEQLRWMYDRARAHGIRVVAGSIIPYNTATPDQNARMREVNDWIRGAAAGDPNVEFVDTRAAAAAPTTPTASANPRMSCTPRPRGIAGWPRRWFRCSTGSRRCERRIPGPVHEPPLHVLVILLCHLPWIMVSRSTLLLVSCRCPAPRSARRAGAAAVPHGGRHRPRLRHRDRA